MPPPDLRPECVPALMGGGERGGRCSPSLRGPCLVWHRNKGIRRLRSIQHLARPGRGWPGLVSVGRTQDEGLRAGGG